MISFRDSQESGYARRWMGWGGGMAVLGATVVVIFLAPLMAPDLRMVFHEAFALLCHQLPDRSFFIGNHPMPVCQRCMGIYLGMLIAGPAFLLLSRRSHKFMWQKAPAVLGASLIPLGADWMADAIGIWVNTPVTRLLTGLVFGITAGYFIFRAAVELVQGGDRPVRSKPVGAQTGGAEVDHHTQLTHDT